MGMKKKETNEHVTSYLSLETPKHMYVQHHICSDIQFIKTMVAKKHSLNKSDQKSFKADTS